MNPFLRLIAALRLPLKKINPSIVVAAHFGMARDKKEVAPAYYLHFEPGRSMIGSGIWRPPPEALRGIRDAIVADPKRWQNITNGADFRSTCGMAGESLKKAPAGYDPNHPLIDDIERKDLTRVQR